MSFFESSCENIRMSRPYTAREYLELMGTTGLEESTECYGFARNDDDCRSSANHAIAISESSIATSAHSCNSCNTPCTCLSGMTSALNAILATVGQMAPGFRVSAEITLKSGTVHSVTFGNPLEPVEICSTTVSFGDTVISVCDIESVTLY